MTSYRENALFNHTLATGDSREVIASRFGEITIDTRNALRFPKGLLGIPQRRSFALASFTSPRMQQFKLLQSLEDPTLSFIVLPLAPDNGLIGEQDAQSVAHELLIHEDDVLMLLIVCVHRTPHATRLSVNARAPVFIDTARKTGTQYVFMHDRYQVQHYIS